MAETKEPSEPEKIKEEMSEILEKVGVTPIKQGQPEGQDPPKSEVDDLVKKFMEKKPGEETLIIKKPKYEEFVISTSDKPELTVDLLKDVSLKLKVELGRAKLNVQDILKLSSGSVIELDKFAGDVLDIYVNDRLVAKGEVLVINDNFAIRITEIISPSAF